MSNYQLKDCGKDSIKFNIKIKCFRIYNMLKACLVCNSRFGYQKMKLPIWLGLSITTRWCQYTF